MVKVLTGILVAPSKYYILPIFIESLNKIRFEPNDEVLFVYDEDDFLTERFLQFWMANKLWIKPFHKPTLNFQLKTVKDEDWMYRVARGREITRLFAVLHNFSHIWFLDADILVEEDALSRLLSSSNDETIVGGLVKTRRLGSGKTWFNTYLDKRDEGQGFPTIEEFKDGEILNVDVTGCDCLFIPRNIFSKIKFEYKSEIPLAEDFGMCFQAKKMGYKILVDTNIQTKHIDLKDIRVS